MRSKFDQLNDLDSTQKENRLIFMRRGASCCQTKTILKELISDITVKFSPKDTYLPLEMQGYAPVDYCVWTMRGMLGMWYVLGLVRCI